MPIVTVPSSRQVRPFGRARLRRASPAPRRWGSSSLEVLLRDEERAHCGLGGRAVLLGLRRGVAAGRESALLVEPEAPSAGGEVALRLQIAAVAGLEEEVRAGR